MNTENNDLNVIGGEKIDISTEKKKNGIGAFFCKMKMSISESPYLYIIGAFFLPLIIMLGAHAAASFYPLRVFRCRERAAEAKQQHQATWGYTAVRRRIRKAHTSRRR